MPRSPSPSKLKRAASTLRSCGPRLPPSKPYFPNRLGIILLGAVLGCGIAFGIAAAVDASDPTLRGNADLQAIMQYQCHR